MIELKNVNKFYNSNGIINLGLRNINLKFNKNEIVAITGDSGSGKSTLLNVITKIDTFDEGEIYYKGNETSYFSLLDMDDFRKNKVGFIFQNYNIIESYTVLENVMLPLLLLGYSNHEAKKRALELINKVGLSNRWKNRGSKLSGGEKQRCVIARALASDCEILACDEPTGNLDSKTGKEIINLIKEISKDKLVLIVTHDYSLVENIATRKIRINDGEIVEDTKFIESICDDNEILDLDYKPINNKTKAKIAKNNIMFTPKKSFFTFLIFFVIFFITIYLFQLIYSINQSIDIYNVYNNKQSDRLYVYTNDKREIDISNVIKNNDKYIINPFFEDKEIPFIFDGNSYINYGLFMRYPNDYQLLEGRIPQSDDEVMILVSNDYIYDMDYFKKYDHIFYDNISYKIVGYAQTNSISKIGVGCKDNLINKVRNDYMYLEIIYETNGHKGTIEINNLVGTNSKIKIKIPNNLKDSNMNFNIILNELYKIDDYEVIYYDGSIIEAYGDLNYIYNNYVFELSVYDSDVDKTTQSIKSLGYEVDIPAEVKGKETIFSFINSLFGYFNIGMCCLFLIIVFFITYFVLAKVYSSKKDDYEIIRTLGITKNDMKTIVFYEVFGIGLSGLVIGFFSFLILTIFVEQFKYLFHFQFLTILIYFIVSNIFIFKIGDRFNKRLFKFSIVNSLKGDDFFD